MRPIPAFIDPAGVDERLAEHVGATLRVAATDGGVIAAQVEEETDNGERPDNRVCDEFALKNYPSAGAGVRAARRRSCGRPCEAALDE